MTDAIVTGLWRYPVKSMMGEMLDATQLTAQGVVGDRGWATRDEVRGGIRGAKKIGPLMQFSARYTSEPSLGGAIPHVIITLPDRREVRTDSPDVSAILSEVLDHEVTLWPLLDREKHLEHYRRGPWEADLMAELREMFGRDSDEELPDLSGMPPEVVEFESPPGTYFDAYPLLLITEESLSTLARVAPRSRVDVRRFRPNVVVRTGSDEPYPEQRWIGRRLAIGAVELEIVTPCPRCVMITRPFADLPEDRSLVKTVVREANHNVGVYARVARPGAVAAGDKAILR
jgi:uncharacterized protein YcbX